jgi:ABC-2 type transport system ATP-binding protein
MTADATHHPPDTDDTRSGVGELPAAQPRTATGEAGRETTAGTGAGTQAKPAAIAVRNLQKTYGSGEGAVTAVDGVSFEIGRGEVVGILGPNGAGKTTTIKSILGLIERSAGTVRINGVDPSEGGPAIYRHVSAVLEGARNVYWRLTVRENLRYFTGIQGVHPDAASDQHDRLLDLVGLEDKADEPVRTLSRGMQQKASLACALARETPVVFLDEPTLGLDVEAGRDLRREIRRLADHQNRTIVLSSHDMDVIQDVCDRVIILNEGRVVDDDSVADLVDVFATQTYRIEFQEPPAASALAAFDATWEADRTAIEVVLEGGEELYALMHALEDAGATVRDLTSLDPDFEEVFLSVIESEDATAEDRSATEQNGGGGR